MEIVRGWRAALLVSMACAAGLMAAPAWAGPYRQVRDWWVHCSNALTCTMTYSASGDPAFSIVGLRRDGRPDAPVELVLPAVAGLKPPFKTGTYRFSVAGRDMLDVPLSDMMQKPDDYQMHGGPKSGLKPLMDAMKAGHTMIVVRDVAGHEARLTVPLSGATGAMLFMDEAQQRLKRSDALVDIGDRAPPAKASLQAIVAPDALPSALGASFTGNAMCSFYGSVPHYFDAFAYDLPEGGRLIGAPCGPGGAYNQPYAFFARASTDGAFERLGLPVISPAGPTVDETVFNIDFDPAKQTVTAFYKGRGLGDCGTYMRWHLDTRNGAHFVLEEQREKEACDGDYAGGPHKWPRVWPK